MNGSEQKLLLIPLEVALDLEKLAAEASEVINAKSKVIEFGPHDSHGKTGDIPNINLVEMEIGHFLYWMEKLIADGILSREEIERHKIEKGPSAKKWREYALEKRKPQLRCPRCKRKLVNDIDDCPHCGYIFPF